MSESQLCPALVQPEVAGCGVVEHEEVQLVKLVELDLLLSTNIAEELGCHGICGTSRLGVAWEVQGVTNTHQPQHVVCIVFQRVILSHQVIVDVTWVTKLVDRLPVLVEWTITLCGRVYQVLNKFFEFDISPIEQCILCSILAVAPDNAGAKALVERRVVFKGELVAVCRDQPLKGLTNKEEFEVVLEAMVDLSNTVLVQRLQVGGNVGFIRRDFHWVTEEGKHKDSEEHSKTNIL